MAIPGAIDTSCKTVLRWGTCTMLRRVDCFDAHRWYARRMAHVWVEKLVHGPEKSACFFGLLRWSVGRHCLLRSRCPCSDRPPTIQRSAFMSIALEANRFNFDVFRSMAAKGPYELGLEQMCAHCWCFLGIGTLLFCVQLLYVDWVAINCDSTIMPI